MSVIPNHLRNILFGTDSINVNYSHEFKGTVVCSCGCNHFHVFRAMYEQSKEEKERILKIKQFKKDNSSVLNNPVNCFATQIENDKELLGYIDDRNHFNLLSEIPYKKILYKPEIIEAKCSSCGRKYEIFNSLLHGYDALCDSPYQIEKNCIMKKYSCLNCKEDKFSINIKLHNIGQLELMEEDSSINENNWMDAFDWIKIDLICSICNKLRKNWFEYETM